MGVDYLHLECLRGALVDEVRREVTEHFTARGWVVVETSAERTVKLMVHGDWVVVEDRPDRFPASWAQPLSKGAGRVGISMRSWTDDGSLTIQRYDEGLETGALSHNASRGLHEARVDTAFLADIAPTRARTRLRKGIDLARLRCDDALELIAKTTGLPPPMSNDQDVEALVTIELAQQWPASARPRERDRATPAVRPIGGAMLHIERPYHVAGIARAELMKGLRDVLAKKGITPRRGGSGRPLDCEIVIVQRGGWLSFGEILHGERRDHGRRILWGPLLSKLLGEPILGVVSGRDHTELTAWSDGRESPVLRLVDEKAGFVVDARCIGVSTPVELGSQAASFHGLAARKVVEAIELSDPFVTGRGLQGIVAAFDAPLEAE